MNFLRALQTSSSGLTVQRIQMNLIANNLSNIHTTQTSEGGPYRRQYAIFSARPISKSFRGTLKNELAGKISEVNVAQIINDPRPPISKYNPEHPDANDKGYVKMPNINIIEEMVNMMTASRSYEANVTAINATEPTRAG